jgi:hypothetical protein
MQAVKYSPSGEADVRTKCPSLRLSTPPPAQFTMNASKMMARITTTTQKPDEASSGAVPFQDAK